MKKIRHTIKIYTGQIQMMTACSRLPAFNMPSVNSLCNGYHLHHALCHLTATVIPGQTVALNIPLQV